MQIRKQPTALQSKAVDHNDAEPAQIRHNDAQLRYQLLPLVKDQIDMDCEAQHRKHVRGGQNGFVIG
jgi:hypothetical protein